MQLCDRVTALTDAADEDALDAGDRTDEVFDLRGRVRAAWSNMPKLA